MAGTEGQSAKKGRASWGRGGSQESSLMLQRALKFREDSGVRQTQIVPISPEILGTKPNL